MLTNEQLLLERLVGFSSYVAAILSRFSNIFGSDDGRMVMGMAKEMRAMQSRIEKEQGDDKV